MGKGKTKKVLSGEHLDTEWFKEIIDASTMGDVMDVIPKLHEIIAEMREDVQVHHIF